MPHNLAHRLSFFLDQPDQSCISIIGTFFIFCFQILLTSAGISKIRNLAIKYWRQQNFKKCFFRNDPFNDVQLWSKFHAHAKLELFSNSKKQVLLTSAFLLFVEYLFWPKNQLWQAITVIYTPIRFFWCMKWYDLTSGNGDKKLR